jgi:hypothetical protein
MKHLLEKDNFLKYFLIILSFNIVVDCSILISQAQARRFPAGGPPEAREEILNLEKIIGLDVNNGIISEPYSEKIIISLLEALNSKYIAVQLRSLHIITEVIRQLDVPKDVLKNKIKPLVSLFDINQFTVEGNNPPEVELERLAKRVLWHINVNEITDFEERVAFLKESFMERPDSPYYRMEAMAYLVEIGNEEAQKVLEVKLTEFSKKLEVQPVTIDQLNLSLEKMKFLENIRTLDPPHQAKEIGELIFNRIGQKGLAHQEFITWAIRKLGEIDTPQAIDILRKIWKDESNDFTYRYETQEILFKLGIITEKERLRYKD